MSHFRDPEASSAAGVISGRTRSIDALERRHADIAGQAPELTNAQLERLSRIICGAAAVVSDEAYRRMTA